ncbi:hypothetical protein P8452_37422 [Trifolium repens]|nr:hypothetical protein P8452_37422 [Trifolium repens]
MTNLWKGKRKLSHSVENNPSVESVRCRRNSVTQPFSVVLAVPKMLCLGDPYILMNFLWPPTKRGMASGLIVAQRKLIMTTSNSTCKCRAAKADAAAARADAAAANANYKSLETEIEEFQRRMMALESGSCSGHSRQSSHPHYDNELDDQSVDEEEDDGL